MNRNRLLIIAAFILGLLLYAFLWIKTIQEAETIKAAGRHDKETPDVVYD